MTSPTKARMAGALYLLSFLTAAFTELFAHGRLNVAGGLIAVVGMLVMTLLLYNLFRPVSRGLSFEALRWQPGGMNVAIVLAGFYCLLIGYLIFKATFLPRVIGALMVLAGLVWLTWLSNPTGRPAEEIARIGGTAFSGPHCWRAHGPPDGHNLDGNRLTCN